jgi:hypothetical protein
MLPVGLPGVLFLNARRVRKDQGAQLSSAGGAEDRSAKPLGDKPRQVTAVIEVRVRQNDGIDSRRVDRKRPPIPIPQLLETLKETAVDQNSAIIHVEQMLRAGDGTGGPKKRQRRRHEPALYSEGPPRWQPPIF